VRPSVLIVDDHASFRTAAARLLEAEGFEVVGVAEDGASAIAAARQLSPDLVLLDIQLPDVDGFAVATALSADAEPPAVVLTSSRSARAYGDRIDAAQVRGFIAKQELSGARLASLLG
jgi:DNA-binding NarL/FixJ family response regulator